MNVLRLIAVLCITMISACGGYGGEYQYSQASPSELALYDSGLNAKVAERARNELTGTVWENYAGIGQIDFNTHYDYCRGSGMRPANCVAWYRTGRRAPRGYQIGDHRAL